MKKLFVPSRRAPTSPGEILVEEFLKPLGISQRAFAKHVHVTEARLSEVIRGKRGITPDTAMRFGLALGTGPEFWINAQVATDLYELQRTAAERPWRDITKITGGANR